MLNKIDWRDKSTWLAGAAGVLAVDSIFDGDVVTNGIMLGIAYTAIKVLGLKKEGKLGGMTRTPNQPQSPLYGPPPPPPPQQRTQPNFFDLPPDDRR